MGAESPGSLEAPVASALAKSLSGKDSRAAECDIVKVIKGAVRLFWLVSEELLLPSRHIIAVS